jgi:thioester reductase-like protein
MKPTLDESYYTQETQLAADIEFNAPLTEHALNPKAVFLTGSTGLVGSFLLAELLKNTQADIYCLVRAENCEQGKQRLITHLQSYQLWQDNYYARVHIVIGDLAQPLFNLTQSEFNQLANTIDVIYQSAGWINLLFPYAKLKPINVTGVETALRLASLIKTKPFHFVSSIAVFYSDAHSSADTLYENTLPKFHPSLKADYGKSKWVADRLVANAQAKGLPATIYRPVRILGDSQTGILNDNSELLPRLIKGCIKMGLYPTWDISITLVPANYVAQAMVYLAQFDSSFGKAFHCFNKHEIQWTDLMGILKDLGYAMQPVSAEEWSKQLRHFATWDEQHDKQFFSMLMLSFMGMHYLFHQRPAFDGANIDNALANSNITCPAIDHDLINRYVHYWQQSGFLPLPISA